MSATRNVGEIIRELRKGKGYTQEELGKKISCTKSELSKIETGKKSPTLQELTKLAKELGTNLSYILGDTLKDEDYQLTTIKLLIKKCVRITEAKEYFSLESGAVLNPDEFIFSLLTGGDAGSPLILQMDKRLEDFIRSIAKIENSKQTLDEKEYDNRILSAIRELDKSERSKEEKEEVRSYCLASVQSLKCIIEEAARKEVTGLQAIKRTLVCETTGCIKLKKPDCPT